MASDLKSSLFFNIDDGTKAQFELQVDLDLYTTALQTILGGTPTKAAGVKAIPAPKRVALKSAEVVELRCKVTNGTGADEKTRSIKLLCERLKASAAIVTLNAGVTKVKLGSKANAIDWIVKKARL